MRVEMIHQIEDGSFFILRRMPMPTVTNAATAEMITTASAI